MHIKPLRSMVGSYGRLRRNVPANIDDIVARKLIARGLAVPVEEAAGTAPVDPTGGGQSRRGGRAGKGKRSSSSAADRAPATTTSGSDVTTPGSSPSTTDSA